MIKDLKHLVYQFYTGENAIVFLSPGKKRKKERETKKKIERKSKKLRDYFLVQEVLASTKN